ncbi:ribosome biogenesis GTP-binding protein YihA/YsxC [Catenovulum sp. 2E275]|nr:ribosome biogenesis GTP-binding protein YihA/YsxC [Catenovulum sp. 2E275]MCU4675829.1 ribosome biogenesis GTP-binding protein YihA/YsxC [Catenovulum sp. 2E275]
MIQYKHAKFKISSPNIDGLGDDSGYEVAFAGRSNAGKSSALNTLTEQKGLARTSKTPGRTQLINIFELDEERRLVDLPGYGFAKVPLEVKKKWQKSLGEYLQNRECLAGLVVLMDIRHPLKDLDQDLVFWAVDSGLPVLILLTKADKLKQGARNTVLKEVRKASINFEGDVDVELFSSLKGIGVKQLKNKLNQWYKAENIQASE